MSDKQNELGIRNQEFRQKSGIPNNGTPPNTAMLGTSRSSSEVSPADTVQRPQSQKRNASNGRFFSSFNVGRENSWKKDFPIFQTHPNLIYLDSAATAQKPQAVINAVTNFYKQKNANVHRGLYDLANAATDAYEGARQTVADFLGAKSEEIVFTGNASEAINFVAYGWVKKFLKKGDMVVLSEMEHHSNIVPWQRLRDEIGVELFYLPIDQDYRLNYQSLLASPVDLSRVKLVTLVHASNVLGTINPIKDIIAAYKSAGIDAKYLVDAAQSIPHLPIDVTDLACNFLVFSGHKLFGPSGIGVLWSRAELLEQMEPLFVGSHMIKQVTKDKTTFADIPHKFEVGTGKLEAAVGLSAAIDYINSIGWDRIRNHELGITRYALDRLSTVKDLQLFGPGTADERLGVFSFVLKGAHAHDVAEILNRHNVAVRSGHHCAQVLMDVLDVPATTRASLSLYNTTEDVDALVEGLADVKRVLKL